MLRDAISVATWTDGAMRATLMLLALLSVVVLACHVVNRAVHRQLLNGWWVGLPVVLAVSIYFAFIMISQAEAMNVEPARVIVLVGSPVVVPAGLAFWGGVRFQRKLRPRGKDASSTPD